MKIRWRTIVKVLGGAAALVLLADLTAPIVNADKYGERLRQSLQRALGRRVELGRVHFTLWRGLGFSVDSVVIHEDPAIGIEPAVYIQQDVGAMEVRPNFWSLLAGRFVVASISLDGASINLTRSGPASEFGRWNFDSFVSPTVMHATPAIHVRNSRINFKFGDTKSVVYLTETDLDITPPRSLGSGWRVWCSAKPARTDRTNQGLGSFALAGRWFVGPERVDLDLRLDRSWLGEITALLRGQPGAVSGYVSSRLHLGGPINNIGIQGRLTFEDLHRWDLFPGQGSNLPLDIRGRWDLLHQELELQSNSPGNAPLPLWLRFRANDYLTQLRCAGTANWNQFSVGPLLDLARNMGAQLPPRLQASGTMDGAIGYSCAGSFQGELAFHNTALSIPDSPPVRFEQATAVFDHGHVRLQPAVVRTAGQDEAEIDADYAMDGETLDLTIKTDSLKVASLREQAALAAVPWLEQVRSGEFSGELRYHWEPANAEWSGHLALSGAEIPLPGLAHSLQIATAHAQIDGARVVLDRIEGAAGKVPFAGEYRYEPGAARPHRVRLHLGEVDAAELEAELMPTLRRSSGLIARALGRTSLPAWLKERAAEGSVQIDNFLLAGGRLQNVRARLVWDAAHLEFDGLQAKLDRGAITGRLVMNLRAAAPSYQLTAAAKGLAWQSGKLDGDGNLETSGTGEQLLAHLTAEGTFNGVALDLGTLAPLRSITGSYNLAWGLTAPRLHLTGLNVRTDEDTYTGSGATRDDGRLVILLTSGAKEMRMSGPLANLKVEEAARQ